MRVIKYNGGYKYQLKATYEFDSGIIPLTDIDADYVLLDRSGKMTIMRGYAWDGPSGPTIDTRNFMRGSLVHDAFYQLMREGHLPHATYRNQADRLLRNLCREDGMSWVRAWWVYQAVRLFAEPASDPSDKRPIVQAPRDEA